MSVSGNSYIGISYIDPNPIKTDIDGTNLYIAGYSLSEQLTNYFVLQADPNKDETKTLLAKCGSVTTKSSEGFGEQKWIQAQSNNPSGCQGSE